MTLHQVDLIEAKARLSDLIEAAIHGAEVLITKANQPVVRLVPVEPERPRPKFGSAKGMVHMTDDFDEPLEEFREYLE